MNFTWEENFNLKGFILARALGNLISLNSFFSKVGEGGAYSFFFLILSHDVDDEGELDGRGVTLGKF